MEVPDQFVLFADLLGFKRLVLDHRVPLWENLDFRNRPLRRMTLAHLPGMGNPLAKAFRAFHGSVEKLLERVSWAEPANLVVFSDSLFLATPHAVDCFHFAEQLMHLSIDVVSTTREENAPGNS